MQEKIWKAFDADAGLWVADYYVGTAIRARSTAIRLRDGGVAVISPGRALAEQSEGLVAEAGPVRFIVAPNSVHNQGLPAWCKAFPEAEVVCTETAKKRLEKRGHPMTGSLASLSAALPDRVRILEVPHCRVGEMWFSVRTAKGTAWLICDAFLNVPALPDRFVGRLIMKMLNMGPGLSVTRQWRWILIRNRKRHKAWLNQRLAEDAPTVLIPAHGLIIREEGLGRSLQRAMY